MHKSITPWLIWFPAALFYCYQFILRVSPSVMEHELRRDFSIDGGTFGLLASFYYIGYCALQIPVGLLCDYFGPRKLLTFAALLCAVSTVFFAISTDFYVAGFWRLLIGVGSSCAFLGCMKLGTLWFPMNRLPLITSATMILGTLGANFGGAPLRILINSYSWRESLLIVAGFGIIIGITIWFVSRDRRSKDNQEQTSVFSGLKLAFTTPQVLLGSLYGFLCYTPLSIFADLWGAGFLQQIYQIPRAEAAFYVNVIYIGLGIGGLFYAWIVSNFITIKTSLRFTTIAVGIPFTLLLLIPDMPLSVMGILLFIVGILIAGESLVFTFVCSHMPVHFSGVTIGLTNMFSMLSGVILQPVIGQILDSLSSGEVIEGVKMFAPGDYRIALFTIPLCIIGAFFISLFFKEPKVALSTSIQR